jgi:tetratricopeptide (TPR) repeat protein
MNRLPVFLVVLALPLAVFSEEKEGKPDPKRIINESNSFLKEREPEMTAEEYALYEKVASMLSSQPEFALKLLQGMVNEQQKPSPAFEFILGNAYYFAGKNEDSATHYKNAIERYPKFLRAWSNLGVLYYSTQKYNEAIPCLAKSVALGDRDPKTFGLLAYCLEQTNNIVQAEMSYMQALSGDPINSEWMEGLLRIYVQGKQFARAEWLVKNMIREHPTETRLWTIEANIMISQTRKVEAMVLLETCAGLGVAGPSELSLLADLYAEQKLIPEAADTYRKLANTDSTLGEKKLFTLIAALIAEGDYTRAQTILDGMKEPRSNEGTVGLLQARADLFAAQKEWAKAKSSLNQLLKIAPLNGPALVSIGRVYLAEDDQIRASLAFEAAYQIPETTFRASLQLANMELRNKHYAKAVEYLEKALSLEKIPTVEDYLARVKTLADKTK